MSQPASLLMGKLFTCHQNNPDNTEFAKHCREVAVACEDDQPVGPNKEQTRTLTPIPRPVSASCSAVCDRLAKCDLAMPTCILDCDQGKLDETCLNAATTCADRARCYWGQECGRPIKSGSLSCTDTLKCWGMHASKPMAEQCSECWDQMSPGASLEFSRYFACWKTVSMYTVTDSKFDVNAYFSEHCQPLMMACYGIKPTP
jgi:hypothetical protein